MQDHPGAPGTARQGSTRTIVSTNDGGRATQPRAPSHERPLAAQRAAGHGWLSAALEAPGADVPLAMTAGAPGQHCLSAALQAPGADLPLAIPARAPGHHRLSAAPIATVPSPAGLRRLRQECLPRVPANPRTLIYSPARLNTAQNRATHSHCLNRHSHLPPRHSRESGNPRPPVATGGPQGGQVQSTPSPGACSGGGLGRGPLPAHHTTHQVHPAIQVPPRPRSCSTACTGFSPQHLSRAPPPCHCGLRRNLAERPHTL